MRVGVVIMIVYYQIRRVKTFSLGNSRHYISFVIKLKWSQFLYPEISFVDTSKYNEHPINGLDKVLYDVP